ncbi:ATP-binding protein [Sphaerisporangium rhizosphaerae]|uniref:histidine kinase n=1 Tax=Sphaerisporangium rhizosphaerae TaxID=2269375 RepID=A0ABW2P9U1_9ACTN
MIRRKLVAAATVTLAVALLTLTAGLYVVLSWRLESDADNVLRDRAAAAASTVTSSQGRPSVRETPYDEALDNGVWVFDAGGAKISGPAATGTVDQTARRLGGSVHTAFHDAGDDIRMYALPLRDEPYAVVVVALSRRPYEHAERTTLIGALGFDALVLAFGAWFVRRTVTQALRPVAQMTAQAARWSERDLDRRFDLGPPADELTGLAATLDRMLGRISAALRHEQRLTAEMAHELRTPLTRMRLETEIALRRDRPAAQYQNALRAVLDSADTMTTTLETLIGLAQQEINPTTGTTPVSDVAADAARTCRDQGREIDVDLSQAAGLVVGCDREVIARTLQPLLDNALRYSRTAISLRVTSSGSDVLFSVGDDGPGFHPGELHAVLTPGTQGHAASPGQGAGLGLALAGRLARSAGGGVTPRLSGDGGLVELRLPAA